METSFSLKTVFFSLDLNKTRKNSSPWQTSYLQRRIKE